MAKWKTIPIEVGDKTYTAAEPSCLAYQEVFARAEGKTFGAESEFVRSCIAQRHPEVTAAEILAGMTPRTMAEAVKALMALTTSSEESKPGELVGP